MTLAKLFGVLFAVNLVTVGGGYVSLPLLHRFFVEDFGWLTSGEFADAIAIGQLTPGPMTIMNVFIGHKVAGFPGALAATVASYLPSVVVVSAVARSYSKRRDAAPVAAALRGLKPAVAGMLLAVTVQLAGASLVHHPIAAGLGVASFVVMAFTKLDPTLVVVAAGLVGAALL